MRAEDWFFALCVGIAAALISIVLVRNINQKWELEKELEEQDRIIISQRYQLQSLQNQIEVLASAFECRELRQQLGLIEEDRR